MGGDEGGGEVATGARLLGAAVAAGALAEVVAVTAVEVVVEDAVEAERPRRLLEAVRELARPLRRD